MEENVDEVKKEKTPGKFKDSIIKFFKEKKLIIIIALAVILLAVAAIIALPYINKKTNLNSNLNNMGFTIQKGSDIYYLGFDNNDIDGLYKVKQNGKNPEKITDNYGFYLNTDGEYIYYTNITTYALTKMKLDGQNKEETVVENIDTNPITVKDGIIYYFKDYEFNRINTDGKDGKKLSDKTIYAYQIVGKTIYYVYSNDDDKYSLAKMDINGENIVEIDNDSGAMFNVKGNTVYYIYSVYDSTNYTYTNALYKINTNGKNKVKIADMSGEISYINITDSGVYYLKTDDDYKSAIYSMKLNGKDDKKITDLTGDITPINLINDVMYYTDNNAAGEITIYSIKTNGKDKQELSLKN